MNRVLTPGEVDTLETFLKRPITRAEKLLRLAQIVRSYLGEVYVFSNLEGRWDRAMLAHPHSAFALASADPLLREVGLQNGTVGEAERFFELSLADLHTFSCDCGGHISNDDMASRIEAIAARAP